MKLFRSIPVLCFLGVSASWLRGDRQLFGRSFNETKVAWLDDKNGKVGDQFGEAVAIQNNVALVTSTVETDYASLDEGSGGQVFVLIDSTSKNDWTFVRTITGEGSSELFGSSVALHSSNGNYFAVVGAPRDHSYGQFAGLVYYFDVETNIEKKQSKASQLIQKEMHYGAFFGSSVAIAEVDGNITVVVGATGYRQRGGAFVYTRLSDGSLGNEQILYESVYSQGGLFGYSVGISGGTVVVGAPVLDHGMVFLYHRTDSSYKQFFNMSPPALAVGSSSLSYFGAGVALGNGNLFVGSPLDYGDNIGGCVYIYDLNGTSPYNIQTLVPPASSRSASLEFGWSIATDPIYGKLIVGGCNEVATFNSPLNKAFVYVYAKQGNLYYIDGILEPKEFASSQVLQEDFRSLFGKGVAIFGDYAVVGAPFGSGEHLRTGDAYIFQAQKYIGATQSESSTSTTNYDYYLLAGAVAFLFELLLIALWRRYQSKGNKAGFLNFLRGGCIEIEDNSLEDSAHSSYPMIVRAGKNGKKKKKRREKVPKKGKSKGLFELWSAQCQSKGNEEGFLNFLSGSCEKNDNSLENSAHSSHPMIVRAKKGKKKKKRREKYLKNDKLSDASERTTDTDVW